MVFGDFLNFASLEIADFAYSSSFQYCLATSATKLVEKDFWPLNLGQKGPKSAQREVFGDLLNFASIEIAYFAYSSSFQYCLAISATKLAEKDFWPLNLGKKGPKRGFRRFS